MNFLIYFLLIQNSVNPVSQIWVSGNLSLILFAIAEVCLVDSGKLPIIRQNKTKTMQNVRGMDDRSMNEIKQHTGIARKSVI